VSDQVIAIVSADANMRAALVDVVEKLGYPCLLLPEPGKVSQILTAKANTLSAATLSRLKSPSPWRVSDCSFAIVDLNDYPQEFPEYDHYVERVSDLPSLYLDIPLPKEATEVDGWRRQVARKIACADAESRYGATNSKAPIWLLLGSTGGPEAIRAFIDALPLHFPVGFLYGQHINPGFENNLRSMLDGRRGYNARIASTGMRLDKGQILIAPPNQRLHLVEKDVVLVDSQPWPGVFQPSLEALVVQFSQRNKNLGGIIVFSGMGDDGSAAVRLYAGSGGRIWVQEPKTCVVSSMPDVILATNCVEYCAEPVALAQKLTTLYKS